MDELTGVYIQECREQLADMEAGLLRLEQAPDDRDNLNGIFRAAHTIKGGAGVIECRFIEHFTHGVENLLDALRNGDFAVTGGMATLLLHDVPAVQGFEASCQRRVVRCGFFINAQTFSESFGVFIQLLQRLHDLLDLLPGDVLELNAGLRVQEHVAKLGATALHSVQCFGFVVHQLLIAVAEFLQLSRKLTEHGLFLIQIVMRELVLKLRFDRLGHGLNAEADLADGRFSFGR